MSLIYARELLKIAVCQLCDTVGFDTASHTAIDMLVDVCERHLLQLAKQTHDLMELDDRQQLTLFDLLPILLTVNNESLNDLHQYMVLFRSLPFAHPLVKFPCQRNLFNLRIPPRQSPQIIERNQNQSTEYIFDWLPLFPDQETSEQQQTFTNVQNSLTNGNYTDDGRTVENKHDVHHPLSLLTLQSNNDGDSIPVGKRPSSSLPSVLYRPRRIVEIEAAAAAEKAKKEQLEKENGEKEQQQQQGPPPPLRLTIPKQLVVTNDKPQLPIKKTTDGTVNTTNKKPMSTPTLNTNTPPVKKTITPPLVDTSIDFALQPPAAIAVSSELVYDFDKNEESLADAVNKQSSLITPPPPAKLPTLKLNIKNVVNTSETPKKVHRSQQPKSSTANPINLKIRTSSLPLFGAPPDTVPIISPPLVLTSETPVTAPPPLPPPIVELPPPISDAKPIPIVDENPPMEIPVALPIPLATSIPTSGIDEEKKKKRKKKHHHDREHREQKRLKKEQQAEKNDLPSTTTIEPPPLATGGALRVKIKLGKAPAPMPLEETPTAPKNDVSEENLKKNILELKPNVLRLTLPIPPSSQLTTPVVPLPPIISTISTTPHRRKSAKVKHVLPVVNIKPVPVPMGEENTSSMDDLPLGERTSPNKLMINPIETTIPTFIPSTPVRQRKKSATAKKKSNSRRGNNVLGVAVIEERRIHYDSQEKVWICPSCNRPDNGQEAMIACDLCDDWYHWECVGIVEEPAESTPWFCPKCHRSNTSTASAQTIKPSASSKAKRRRAAVLFQKQHSLL